LAHSSEQHDVIVVGGGNAAINAALAARHAGKSVLLLERGSENMRGGNTRHTRNLRYAHDAADDCCDGPYTEESYLNDLVRQGVPANMDLARYTIRESKKLPRWMSEHGVNWQSQLSGTLHQGHTNRWFLGGGKAMLNCYYRTAERMGIEFRYDACVEDLIIENERFVAAVVRNTRNGNGNATEVVRGHAVVVAAGGFEANLEWLGEYWGKAADNFIVRGTPYNDGVMLKTLLQKGAKSIGDPKQFHAITVDARAPKYDGGIAIRLDAVPFGVVVNEEGHRFDDEGLNVWPIAYARWGALIAQQTNQIAYAIVDSQTINKFLPPMYPAYRANSFEELAGILKIDAKNFVETMAVYNRGTAGNTGVRIQYLDGVCTRGVTPPKTNWAQSVNIPPFYGFPMRPGITFTYMGLCVDDRARVVDQRDRPFRNVYAAGEIMSGNILSKGYLGGIGLVIGAVFGQLAGTEAANSL
jgi:tricarballylate dehydrogenase